MSGDGKSWVERNVEIASFRGRVQQPVSRVEADWLGMKRSLNSAGETIINISDNSVGVPAGLNFRAVNSLRLRTVFVTVEHQFRGKVDFPSRGGLACPVRFEDNLNAKRV